MYKYISNQWLPHYRSSEVSSIAAWRTILQQPQISTVIPLSPTRTSFLPPVTVSATVPTVGHFSFPFLKTSSTLISLNTPWCALEGIHNIKLPWDCLKVVMGQKVIIFIKASQGELQSSSPESAGHICCRWQTIWLFLVISYPNRLKGCTVSPAQRIAVWCWNTLNCPCRICSLFFSKP